MKRLLRDLGAASLAGVLAGLWLLLCDRLAAWAVSLSTPLSGRGLFMLLGAFVTCTAGLLVFGALLAALRRVVRLPDRAWVVGLGFAVLAIYPAWWVADALTAGEWIAKQSWAGSLKIGATAGVIAGAGVLGLLQGWLGRRAWWGALLLVGAVVGAQVDVRVLPGLYGELHLFLELVVLVLAALGTWSLLAGLREREWRLPLVAAGGLAFTVCVASPITAQLLKQERSALMLASPIAANVVPQVILKTPTDVVRVVLQQLDLTPGDAPVRELPPLPPRPDWNVMLVVSDTLRADALPPAREQSKMFTEPGQTPQLDRWIGESYRFRWAYAQASRTMFSMPAMMRSRQGASRDPSAEGVPLPEVMAARGRVPVAILPQYFLDPEDPPVKALTEGYEDVAFYEKNTQQDLVPKVREVLSGLKGRPFFAWVHFYNMHQPGFAEDRILTKRKDGPLHQRYKMSLRWFDAEWGKLIAVLEELGLKDNTIVLLASDHGEFLGENKREGHGGSVRELETRVPWVVYVPGMPGGVREQTVGNVDIAPTLVDLLGAPPEPSHEGRSVRLLLEDADADWPFAYSQRSTWAHTVGLAWKRHKMNVHKNGAIIHRFHVEEDPLEEKNLFDLHDPMDQRMLLEVLVRRPDLAAREIKGDSPKAKINRDLLLAHLKSVKPADASRLGQRLNLLVGLVALSPTEPLLAELDRLFVNGDDHTRGVIAKRVANADPDWTARRLVAYLETVANTPAEVEFLNRLAVQGQPPFAGQFVGQQITAAAKGKQTERLQAWLRLTAPWMTGSRNFGRAYLAALDATDAAQAEHVERILNAVTQLNIAQDTRMAEQLRTRIEPHLDHPDLAVRIAAAEALARNGPMVRAAIPKLVQVASNPQAEVRFRSAVMVALARIGRANAVKHMVELAQADPLLTYEAIKALEALGKEAVDALPYLKEVRKTHWRRWVRVQAGRAIKTIAR